LLANLQHYLCAALIGQMQLILAGETDALIGDMNLVLAGRTSALGNPLPVTIYRASPATLPGPPPHIWIEAQAPQTEDQLAPIGNTVGLDGNGNQEYGSVLWGPLVDFGLRCALPAERDDIFDRLYRAFAGFGINPTTGERWIFDINVNTGIIVADVVRPRLTTVETTQYGPLFEATASLVITTVTVDSVAQETITAIDINPVLVTITVPTE